MSASYTKSNSDLRAVWGEVGNLLRAARACLPVIRDSAQSASVPAGSLSGTLDEFEEFLEHNELELAWDALATVAERYSAPTECWRLLAHAAGLMGLAEKQKTAALRVHIEIP